MPTMWVTVSFRDAIKLSIAKLPKVKDTGAAKVGFDVSPRLVRKHGGKLPFQLNLLLVQIGNIRVYIISTTRNLPLD